MIASYTSFASIRPPFPPAAPRSFPKRRLSLPPSPTKKSLIFQTKKRRRKERERGGGEEVRSSVLPLVQPLSLVSRLPRQPATKRSFHSGPGTDKNRRLCFALQHKSPARLWAGGGGGGVCQMRCVLCAVLRGRSVGLPPPRSSFSFLWFSQALSFALLSDSSKVPPLSIPPSLAWAGGRG